MSNRLIACWSYLQKSLLKAFLGVAPTLVVIISTSSHPIQAQTSSNPLNLSPQAQKQPAIARPQVMAQSARILEPWIWDFGLNPIVKTRGAGLKTL